MKPGILLIGLMTITMLLSLSEVCTRNNIENRVVEMQDDIKQIKLFLCGDVMTGRGIDQILPYPGNPEIFESYVKDARRYVTIAEQKNGRIKYPVSYSYIWGDALKEFDRTKPDLKIINLETSITTNDSYWTGKGIQYRMHPNNIECLSVVDNLFCSLGNNHILDWGYKGLEQTINVLDKAEIKHAGAGVDFKTANRPAVIEIKGKGRILVVSYGMPSSGVYSSWEAQYNRSGVNLLRDLSSDGIREIKTLIESVKHPGDIVVFSLHWGGNWGYEITSDEMEFVHKLIDSAHVDVFHGHSSHHFKAIEVYHNKLILYGSGDFLNDYEGIGGRENYRSELTLMYFASVDPKTGNLLKLEITPMEIRNFRVNEVGTSDLKWVKNRLNRECKKYNSSVTQKNNRLFLNW
jgi:poly-gamma-glutamate synthesis protein (capsule biosynthesis protein)